MEVKELLSIFPLLLSFVKSELYIHLYLKLILFISNFSFQCKSNFKVDMNN